MLAVSLFPFPWRQDSRQLFRSLLSPTPTAQEPGEHEAKTHQLEPFTPMHAETDLDSRQS